MTDFWKNYEFLTATLQGLALLLALSGAALLFWRWLRARKGAGQAELDAIDKAKNTLEHLADSILFGAVTEAERTYGGGTGELKRSLVIQQLIALLPESLRDKIDLAWAGTLVDKAVEAAKKIWQQKPKMLDNGDE
ncbi:MAG: hypothetical protein LBJ11_07760 [Oscillospiraceae bacterium]|nr:hypothetical protein [Oscillospiraceae bacterium]